MEKEVRSAKSLYEKRQSRKVQVKDLPDQNLFNIEKEMRFLEESFHSYRWVCPQCGQENKGFSRSLSYCHKCGYTARSFTEWLRHNLRRYHGAELDIELIRDKEKGKRRRPKPFKIRGRFLSIYHNPKDGFLIEMLVTNLDGKKIRYKTSLPLLKVLPWGPLMVKTIQNLEVIFKRPKLTEPIRLPSPEARLEEEAIQASL